MGLTVKQRCEKIAQELGGEIYCKNDRFWGNERTLLMPEEFVLRDKYDVLTGAIVSDSYENLWKEISDRSPLTVEETPEENY